MKAIIWTRYGPPDVLQLREVKKPVPRDNEVLIRIYSGTVTAGDCETRELKLPFYISFPMRMFFGLIKPKRVNILQVLGVQHTTREPPKHTDCW